MKITKMKKSGNKYQITLSDNTTIKTYDDVIINNGLLYHKEIDSETLHKLNLDTSYYDMYYKTVNYISKKLRSEKEIKNYLDKINAGKKEKDSIIKKLKEIGLLNDKSFAKAFISDRMNLSNDGPYKIKKVLYEHDLTEETIEDAFNGIDYDFTEKLTKLISKKVQSSKYSGYVLKQKILNDFINLGYDREMISDIYDHLSFDKSALLKKEYDKVYKKLSTKYSDKELENRIKTKLYQKGFNKEEIDSIM